MSNCNFNDMVISTNRVKGAFLDQAIQQVLCKSIHKWHIWIHTLTLKQIGEGMV